MVDNILSVSTEELSHAPRFISTPHLRRMMDTEDRHLVYVTGTDKGKAFYGELRHRYATSEMVDVTPRNPLSRGARMVARRFGLVGSLRAVRRLDSLRLASFLRRRARNGRQMDVVMWSPAMPITARWKHFGRLLPITDVPLDDEYFASFSVPKRMVPAYRKEWSDLARYSDRIYTLSEWAAEGNRRLYPREAAKIEAIGWGSSLVVTPDAERLDAAVRGRRVLTVGHGYERKGIPLFDAVAGRIRAELPDVEFVAVGDPEGFDSSNLSNVTLLGPQPGDGVAELMTTSQVFMLLSRYEPSAHVVIEAQAHGLPVVVTRTGGVHEAVVDGVTGFGCSLEVDEVVAAVRRLLVDDELREGMSRAARAHAATLSWRGIAERWNP